MLQKFSNGMPEPQVKALLYNVMPDRMRTTIFEHREIKNYGVMELVEWARQQTAWTQQTHLATIGDPQHHIAALKQRRRPQKQEADAHEAPQPPPVHAVGRPDRYRTPGPPGSWPKDKQGRPLNPWVLEFKGCHHCGVEGHTRQQCKPYLDLISQHGGKPPNTYRGKLELYCEEKAKALRQKPRKITAVTKEEPEPSEGTESDWSDEEMGEQEGQQQQPKMCTAVVEIKNRAEPPASDDDSPTPAQAAEAAKNIIKTSMKHKMGKFKKLFSIQRRDDIEILERFICSNSKKDVIPPKNVKNTIWAMVDSGSEPTVADAGKHFPRQTVRPSAGSKRGLKYMAANGQAIPNRGEFDITHADPKHGNFKFTFQDAPVHCPIISIRSLVDVGCSVTFKGKGSFIKYADGRKLNFVLKDGVYFIAINVLSPDVTASPVFSRQGQA